MFNLPVDCFLPSSDFTFLSISILILHSFLLIFFLSIFKLSNFLSEKIVRNYSVLHTYTEDRNEKPDNSFQNLWACITVAWQSERSSLIKHTYKHFFCYTWRLWNKKMKYRMLSKQYNQACLTMITEQKQKVVRHDNLPGYSEIK